MKKSTRDNTKKRADQPGTFVGVRLQPPALQRLDGWIERQNENLLSRPEAIRRLINMALQEGMPNVPVTPKDADEKSAKH